MVENQFGKRIKNFQSNEGGEFNNFKLATYLQDHGIQHLKACPKTPPQNSMAKRCHHTIIELELIMMIYANVPYKYLTDSFSTAVWILNRLPTPTLLI